MHADTLLTYHDYIEDGRNCLTSIVNLKQHSKLSVEFLYNNFISGIEKILYGMLLQNNVLPIKYDIAGFMLKLEEIVTVKSDIKFKILEISKFNGIDSTDPEFYENKVDNIPYIFDVALFILTHFVN